MGFINTFCHTEGKCIQALNLGLVVLFSVFGWPTEQRWSFNVFGPVSQLGISQFFTGPDGPTLHFSDLSTATFCHWLKTVFTNVSEEQMAQLLRAGEMWDLYVNITHGRESKRTVFSKTSNIQKQILCYKKCFLGPGWFMPMSQRV